MEKIPETWEEFLIGCDQIEDWAESRKKRSGMSSDVVGGVPLFYGSSSGSPGFYKWRCHSQSTALSGRKVQQKDALHTLGEIYRYSRADGDYSYRDETDAFNDGKTAMYINGIWGAPMISDQIDAAYALLPSEKGEKISCVSACLGYILGKTGDEKKQDASVRFVKYMLSTPVQERILKETEQVPANPHVDIRKYQKDMERFVQAADTVKAAGVRIQVPDNLWSSGPETILWKELMMF